MYISHIHTHTHTYSYTQTYTHRYTHTHTDIHTHRYTHTHTYTHIYRKQEKLSGRKLSWFSWIFNEAQKFSLLIDRRHTIDINYGGKIVKACSTFSQILPNHKTFLLLNFCCLQHTHTHTHIHTHAHACTHKHTHTNVHTYT